MTHHHHATHTDPESDSESVLAELLDLDAEVLADFWNEAFTSVQLAAGAGSGRVLDLGAGSGVATIALAQRFGNAEVIAVDASVSMLARVRAKAAQFGLSPRIQTLQTDLDEEWPPVGPIDVTWASMSMHHLTDPDRVLANVFAATRPGGVLAVVEMAERLRFLPDDVGLGRPGLEQRCLDLVRAEHTQVQLEPEWAPRLTAAGFELLSERSFTIDAPGSGRAALRYARLWLERLRTGVAERLTADDRVTLAALLDGGGLELLPLQLSGARTVTLARRPAGS